MEHIKSMLFLHDLEIELHKEMHKFEQELRNRWANLPVIEANTIYHVCPYFEDIDNYFEKGIMRIANIACRQYRDFSGQSKELSWYSICNDYSDVLEELCKPYIDAFEAVSSKGLDRLRETRAKLESASSGRSYGYITNSFSFALMCETFNAISGALKAVENDNLAWQSATEPQRRIHNQLSTLWSRNYNKVFMERVCAENKAVISAIIENFALSFRYTYDYYLEVKKSAEFANALQMHQKAQKEQEKQKRLNKQQQKKLYIEQLNEEINAADIELSNLGLAIWGEKRAKKKSLEEKKALLQAELRAIENPLPLQSTYIAYLSHNSSTYNAFMGNNGFWYNNWYNNNSKERWRFEYSEKHGDYVAYTPQNRPLFTLGQGFLQKYGRYRKIEAKYEGCPSDNYRLQVAEMEWSLFEIKE